MNTLVSVSKVLTKTDNYRRSGGAEYPSQTGAAHPLTRRQLGVQKLRERRKDMKLSNTIAIWEILHTRDTGDIGFSDLADAIKQVDGEENDISHCQPAT